MSLLAGGIPTAAELAALANQSLDVRFYTANDTWAKPSGADWVWVRCIGAGGAGGAVALTGALQYAAAAGGGGGGYVEKWFPANALSSTETVVVGTGATAPSAGNTAGGNGGNSSFTGGGVPMTAGGGSGGQGSGANASQTSSATAGALSAITSIPGAGGTATGGDVNVPGGSGQPGLIMASEIRFGSWGGAAGFGYAPPRVQGLQSTGAAGQAGQGYGGGGAGATNGASQAARAGGAGANGLVIVVTFRI